MKPVTLSAQFSAEMDCRKAIVMRNYHDHEHLVGTDSGCVTTQTRSWSEGSWFNRGGPWNLALHLRLDAAAFVEDGNVFSNDEGICHARRRALSSAGPFAAWCLVTRCAIPVLGCTRDELVSASNNMTLQHREVRLGLWNITKRISI